MTVGKGTTWGEPGVLPPSGVVVRSDAEAAAVVADAQQAGRSIPTLGLLAGDLARTCGATGDEGRLHGPDAQRLPTDVGQAEIDGTAHVFVAHLVVRRRWWRGPVTVVMNAQFLGDWDVAPRSHPNDGRLDLLEADLSLGDRWKAWRRLPTGTHLPHPDIRLRRITDAELSVPAGARVWLDGTCVGRAWRVSVRCTPDALVVVV